MGLFRQNKDLRLNALLGAIDAAIRSGTHSISLYTTPNGHISLNITPRDYYGDDYVEKGEELNEQI